MTQIAQGAHVYLFPEPGQVYRVQADDVATVQVLYGAPSAVITLTAQSQTFGPYDSPAKLKVTANTGPAEYTLIRAHYAELTQAQLDGGAVGALASNNAGVVIEPDGDVPTLGGSVTLPAMQTAFDAGTAPQKAAFQASVSGDLLAAVPPAATADVIKGVYINSGFAYVRYPWSTTQDAVQMVRLTGTDPLLNSPVDMFGVRVIPIATAHSAASVASAFAAATGASIIAVQSDSIAPLNYNGTFIGANHGAFVAHQVTATGHGKTAADIGSEWNGPGGRKFYIFRIVSANALWLVSSNSGTAEKWVFYTTLLTGQTLTHSSGAASATDIVVTGDVLSQLMPCLSRRSLTVRIDGVTVAPSSVAAYSPGSFEVVEGYSIVNPAAAVDYLKAAPGTGRSFFDDSIAVDVTLLNTHRWNSNGCRTTEQATTWGSAVNLFYQGVVQDIPPAIISGGALLQYVDGVNVIGAADYKATVDITSSLTPFSATAATWTEATTAPSRMAQIVTLSGVKRYGTVLGCSLLRGVTTRRKRPTYCNDALGIPSAATKKQYLRPVTKAPAVGDAYTVIGYHHTYNLTDLAPDATVATWYKDGPDYVVVLDFHAVSARTRVILPPACDGYSARLLESQAVSLLTSAVIDGGGIAVSCSASYGYAIIRVSRV